MQTKKMSLANIQGKMNRNEMKQIMAGSGCGVIVNCGGGNYANPNCENGNCTHTSTGVWCGSTFYSYGNICQRL